MCNFSFKFIEIYLIFFILKSSTPLDNVKSIFGSNLCIPGSLSTITVKEAETLAVTELENYIEQDFKRDIFIDEKHYPNVLLKLHELAQFNEVDYHYKLIEEKGPPHNKLFTVGLILGNVEYIGQGSSLKKAQQKCAIAALEQSEYEQPVTEKKENIDALTPTLLLNNLCAKLGIGIEYFLVKKNFVFNSNDNVNGQIKKTYSQKLNESMYSNIHINKDDTETKGPFNVGVKVGDVFFYGMSNNIQQAKHDAASKAIEYLVKVVQEGDSVCLMEGSEDECKQAKANLKSPISLVYEAAQLRNLHVDFEVIEESGLSHKKLFVTKCTLGHLSSMGEGKSKKESKKMAASNMMDMIPKLPEVSLEMQVNNIIKRKKQQKKKKKSVLKTNFDIINMHIDNIINTVKDYGLPFTHRQEEHTERKKSKSGKSKYTQTSFQREILELGNILKFDVQFMDYREGEEFYTIMSLHIDPEYICLGEGFSLTLSRNKAAKAGLILLQNVDFSNHLKNTKLTFLESELKQKIAILLNKQVYEDQKDNSKLR